MKHKPKMPKEDITIHFMVTAKLRNDLDRFSNGHLFMTIADCERVLRQGTKRVGAVGAAIGGTVFVEIEGRLWALNTVEMFESAQLAERQQYLSKR